MGRGFFHGWGPALHSHQLELPTRSSSTGGVRLIGAVFQGARLKICLALLIDGFDMDTRSRCHIVTFDFVIGSLLIPDSKKKKIERQIEQK